MERNIKESKLNLRTSGAQGRCSPAAEGCPSSNPCPSQLPPVYTLAMMCYALEYPFE